MYFFFQNFFKNMKFDKYSDNEIRPLVKEMWGGVFVDVKPDDDD